MALTRVYCGLAATDLASWLTVAVVDDAGRLLDLCELSDDPAGYGRLGALLAERSTGAAAVAADRGDHLIGQLLAAANRPIAIADPESVADFAERFCDDDSPDERDSPPTQRRAVGLARALQAGALSAMAQTPAWELDDFKPVLAAHAAVTAGRQAAAVALREVLRELYPAALRAYPDPAECVPLKILDALPEPGMLSTAPSAGNRDASLVAELCATGVADPTTAVAAITALRVAAQESPRRNAHRMLGPVVAETVRQAVAAVRACDAASAALVATLVERLGPMSPTVEPQRPRLVPVAPVSPAPRRTFGPAAEVPANRVAPRERTPSAAAAGVAATPTAPAATPFSPTNAPFEPAAAFGPTHAPPAVPTPRQPSGFSTLARETTPSLSTRARETTPSPSTRARETPPSPSTPARETPPSPSTPARETPPNFRGVESRSGWPLAPTTDDDFAVRSTSDHTAPSPSRPSFESDPLTAPLPSSPVAPVSPSRVPPPWHAADMPTEPPALRLVETPRPGHDFRGGDPLTDPLPREAWGDDPFEGLRFEPPVLRVIDGEGKRRSRRPSGDETASAPSDGDLLIFSETRSAWFTEVDEYSFADDDTATWGQLSDEGWRAAEQLARPAVGADTMAGLPRRVPQANLVPGAPQQTPRQLRIVRDPESIAAHTTGYFRGWRRGQEIGGFAVGQRDRAAWEFNREQRAREGSRDAPDAAARLH